MYVLVRFINDDWMIWTVLESGMRPLMFKHNGRIQKYNKHHLNHSKYLPESNIVNWDYFIDKDWSTSTTIKSEEVLTEEEAFIYLI